MNKKYYLLTTQSMFYDRHGTPDDGGLKLEVTTDEEYATYKEGVYYNEEGEEDNEDEEDENYAQDGYNCELDYFMVRSITEDEYNSFGKIISEYENLK